ncbi:MAG: acylneuraminate cytidylyltransferase family protein [Magnetococcales bacterium]|nr:acylneuraminate cytidylyltransferase family protein [Magnetococcales bacterium]
MGENTTTPKILGLTLARGGSKSIHKKNIKLLNGVPLIAYTIVEALLSRYLTRYIVSTDDEEIRDVALAYGAEVPFLRPNNLSSDTASSMAAMQHAVAWVEADEGVHYDYVIELMCTNPMKTVSDIDGSIQKLINTGADSVIAVHRLDDHHPIRIKKIVDDKLQDFCLPEKLETRRQDLKPDAYIRSGSIYALTRDHLMVDSQRYGSNNSRPWILDPHKGVNLDSKMDFRMAELLLAEYPRPHINSDNAIKNTHLAQPIDPP